MHSSYHPHPALLSFAILLLISGCVLDAEEIKAVVADPVTKKNLDSHLCGNNVPEGDEECDDGNTDDGDGCSADCKIEGKRDIPNYCGDGNTRDNEACDDGNTDDGDGCSADCKIEDGYECYFLTATATCFKTCGDGIADVRKVGVGMVIEECDDGNNVNGDGCSTDCKIEDGFKCFNNYSDANGILELSDTIKLHVTFRDLEGDNTTINDIAKCMTENFKMPMWLSTVGIPKLMTAHNNFSDYCNKIMYSDDPKVELFSRLYDRAASPPKIKEAFVTFVKRPDYIGLVTVKNKEGQEEEIKVGFPHYEATDNADPKFHGKRNRPFTTEFHATFRHINPLEFVILSTGKVWAYIDDYHAESLAGKNKDNPKPAKITTITFDENNSEELHELSVFHVNHVDESLYGVLFPPTLIAPSVCEKKP